MSDRACRRIIGIAAALCLVPAAVPAMAQHRNPPRRNNLRAEFEKDVATLRQDVEKNRGVPWPQRRFPAMLETSRPASGGEETFTVNGRVIPEGDFSNCYSMYDYSPILKNSAFSLPPLLDSGLRFRIVHLARLLNPPPAYPDQAQVQWEVGKDKLKAAQQASTPQEALSDFQDASNAYMNAIDQAPWIPDYYFDAGAALQGELDKDPSDAAEAIAMYRWYLAIAPQGRLASAAAESILKLKGDYEAKCDSSLDESESWTPVVWGAEDDDLTGVRTWLDQGADVNATDEDDETALMYAADAGFVDMARLLLEHGADVNAKGVNDFTAFDRAADADHLDMVQFLVAHGADVNANDGDTALILAARDSSHLDVVRFLVAHRVDVNAKDSNGDTALIDAVDADHLDVAQWLAAHGADVNAKDNDGDTALIEASAGGFLEVVQTLVAHGADVNAIDNNGDTALSFAVKKGHQEVVAYLESHGSNP